MRFTLKITKNMPMILSLREGERELGVYIYTLAKNYFGLKQPFGRRYHVTVLD